MTAIQEILDFWYSPAMSAHWFRSTAEIDANIFDQYGDLWRQAAQGKLNAWQESPEGCLALCIVLDQFPLNMFRGEKQSFSTEQQAVAITKLAVQKRFDRQLPVKQRAFLYMPLMHSEQLADQDLSVALFENSGLAESAQFAIHHRNIIRKFGRFPHRNQVLGRESTQAEIDYLNSPEAFTG